MASDFPELTQLLEVESGGGEQTLLGPIAAARRRIQSMQQVD